MTEHGMEMGDRKRKAALKPFPLEQALVTMATGAETQTTSELFK